MFDKQAKTEALIFDLDGTLLDTMPAHYGSWTDVAKEEGFEISEKLFYELAGVPSRIVAGILNERYGYGLDPDAVQKRKVEFFLERVKGSGLIKPVADLVYKYHNVFPMAVGTGARGDIARRLLDENGLSEYFTVVVTADDVKYHKPDPETFLKCAQLLGVKPEICEVFEDGELGLEAARKAGMTGTDIRKIYQKA